MLIPDERTRRGVQMTLGAPQDAWPENHRCWEVACGEELVAVDTPLRTWQLKTYVRIYLMEESGLLAGVIDRYSSEGGSEVLAGRHRVEPTSLPTFFHALLDDARRAQRGPYGAWITGTAERQAMSGALSTVAACGIAVPGVQFGPCVPLGAL